MIKLNDHQVRATIFPDGTSQVWKVSAPIERHNRILWQFESEAEFMHLAQLQHLITAGLNTAELHLPYLPYGRQDKPVSNNSSFALRTFAHLLNSLHFTRVTAFDPHNANALHETLRGFTSIRPTREIAHALDLYKPDVVVYPDAGARERYADIIPSAYPSRAAEKMRDQATGEILCLRAGGEVKGQRALIVDDICDGGATFIALAACMSDAADIGLYVSHGLFTKGTQVLRDAGIRRIFTQDGEIK